MPAPIEAASPTSKRLPGVVRGEGGREDRRQRRHRSVHQPGQSRLHIGQDELAAFGRRFLVADLARHQFLLELLRQRFMTLFGRGQVAEQLARRGVGGAFDRLEIEKIGLPFHRLRLRAHRVDAQRPHQPVRLALVKSLDVLAPDQGNTFAEALAVQFDQRSAVAVFLHRHRLEHLCRLRISFGEPVGVGAVDARVVLLGGDGQRQHFLLRQGIETSGGRSRRRGKA